MKEEIYNRIKSCEFLPSLPHVVAELMQATLSDSTSAGDIAKIIQKDPSLTGHVLKVVNSSFYGLSRKITSPSQAIIVLGLRAVQNISLTASVFRTFHNTKTRGTFSMEQFWWHSVVCTLTIKHLSARLGFSNEDEAFVAGLLHDIGKLVLYTGFPDDYEAIIKQYRNGENLFDLEESFFGVNHADVGGWLLESWNLQPFLIDAVRYHHRDLEGILTALPLVKLAYLANILSHAIFEPKEEDDFGKEISLAGKLFGTSLVDIAELRVKLTKEAGDFAECMGISSPSSDRPPGRGAVCTHVQALSQKKQEELSGAVKDASLLLGMLRALLEAKDSGEIIDIIFEALSILFSFESAILMSIEGKRLVGNRAFGTKRDDLVKEIVVDLDSGEGVWQEALSSKSLMHSKEYFKTHPYRIIDEQIQSFLSAPSFSILPLNSQGETLGLLVLPDSDKHACLQESLLTALSAQAAAALRSHRLRNRFVEVDRLKSAIVQNAPVGLISLDHNGVITHFNPVAREIFGLSTEVVGLPIDVVNSSSDLKKRVFLSIRNGSYDIPFFEHCSPSNKKYWLACRVVPLGQSSKEGLLLLIQDVTDRVNSERMLRDYTTSLEKAVQEKTKALEESQALLVRSERIAVAGRIARKIAHEVNNPLGIIKNYLQIIRLNAPESDPQKESLRVIDEELDRIASILRQLSDLSRADLLNLQMLDINHLVQDLVRIMDESYRKKGIRIILDLSEQPAYANVDPDKFKQVFINLIKNAEEAMPDGGEIRLRIRLFETGGKKQIGIEVADTGGGIPEEVLKHIFDPFYSTKGLSNSGLGLSVSLGIVKGLGGEINVETGADKGTTFTILFPAA
ncbi:MAG: HDOD domain-containing protein [Pseudomonadota bacterium]